MAYDPNILLTVYATATKYYSQRPVVISGQDYGKDGIVINNPEFDVSMPDELTGVANPFNLSIEINDLTLIDEDIRGMACKVDVYDPTDGVVFIAYGQITDYNEKFKKKVSLSLRMNEDQKLETMLPKDLITTDTFHATARDVGKPINIIFGYGYRVRCYNVRYDTEYNIYDYLIGYSETGCEIEGLNEVAGVSGVWRGGKLASTADYTLLNNPNAAGQAAGLGYTGYAVIRFTTPQRDFDGNYFEIYADVLGLELTQGNMYRQRMVALSYLLGSAASFGLGDSYDATSLTAAATALNDLDLYGIDFVIGNGEQHRAVDIVNDILFPYGYMYRASDGELEFTILNGASDQLGSSVLTIGDNDGYKNNCNILSIDRLEIADLPKTLQVNYNFRTNANNEQIYDSLICTTTRSIGTDKIVDLPTVAGEDAADRAVSIIWGRSVYSDYKAEVDVFKGGRAITLGNKVTIANTSDRPFYVSGRSPVETISSFFVTGFRKIYGEKYEFDIRSTHANFFNYTYTTTSITGQDPVEDHTGVVRKTYDFTAVDNTIYAIDTRGDTKFYNIWRFESGALTTDSQGNDTLSATGTPVADTDSGDYVEGSASAYCQAGSDYFSITDAALSANNPLNSDNGDGSGQSTQSITIIYPFKFDVGDEGTGRYFIKKSSAGQVSFSMSKNPGDEAVAAIGQDGTNFVVLGNDVALSSANWYGMILRYNYETDTAYLDILDIDGDIRMDQFTYPDIGGFFLSTADLQIGLYDGHVDNVRIAGEFLSYEDCYAILMDPDNYGPVEMTLPTSPNSLDCRYYDAYNNFATENFTITSSAKLNSETFGTHTYNHNGAAGEFVFVNTDIGYTEARAYELIDESVEVSGGGTLTYGATVNVITDSSTYTLPLAATAGADAVVWVMIRDEDKANTPTVQRGGSDTITDEDGTDTSVSFDAGISMAVAFISDGVSDWSMAI